MGNSIRGFFIFQSCDKVALDDGVVKYLIKLQDFNNQEFVAYDIDISNRENHEYPDSNNKIVYVKLEQNDDESEPSFQVINILPAAKAISIDYTDRLKGKRGLSSSNTDLFPQKNPPRMKELDAGRFAGVFLLVAKEDRSSQRGKYYELTLLNKSDRIVAKDFLLKTARIEVNTPVNAVLNKSEKYGYSIESISESNEFEIKDFVRHPPFDEEKMYLDILSRLKMLVLKKHNSIANVSIDIYEKYRDRILYWSAAKEMHHNFFGGLLFHTFRMMNLANGIINTYETVNADLVLAAVAIHDIGKLFELETNAFGESTYTVQGSLLGHSLIGIELIDQATAGKEYDAEEVMLLKHCIAAHHGEYDFGAISKPQIEEAFLLHVIDLIDSRVYMFENEYSKLTPGQKTDKKVFAIDAPVYRPSFTEGETFQDDYSEG